MLGYNTDHSKPPISIPASFGSPVQHESYVNTSSTIYQVDIYSPVNSIDPSTVPGLSNYFVLIYRTTNNSGADNYNRAIMEVIPKSKYPNASTILAKFKQYPRTYNRYHSIVSDEDLLTNDKFGLAGEESQSPFLSISKNGGSNEVLLDHSDISSQTNVNAMPLIDVRQVDDNYNFTGVKYAYSAGGGLITINNPRYGIYPIDSRNFLVPATSVPLANMVSNIVPTILAPLALN
jgi:hypothetical protein